MYFKKLDIFGFKSFAERTILRFEPGITAVVGPNGCGKSNIFDSIRWALGEQSIKSLRGSKSEDVIFNGTEKIPALGFAEVSVTLSNETHILPIDYEEVTITRRLYRSGESEYLLNNNPVRLKDITEMLMGTGIGAESYSLIEQGKISLVLSSKPEDRRLVFDEATGVSKYKTKKKEALRRLEDTDNNLLRVNDIILEVKRQIGSIERQAAKARRYKDVFERLKDLEIKLALTDINKITNQYQELESTKSNHENKFNQLTENLVELDKKVASLQDEIESINKEIVNLNNGLINNKNSIERDTQHIKINADRIQELNTRLLVIESQKTNLLSRIEHNQGNLEKIKESLSNITEESQEREEQLNKKNQEFKKIEEIIHAAREKIKNSNTRTFEIVSLKTKHNNELIDISSSLNNLAARKRRLETESLKTSQEKETNQNELKSIKGQVEELRSRFQTIKKQSDAQKNILHNGEKEILDIEEQINKLQETRIRLESQKEFLQELKMQYEDMPSASNAELIINDFEKINAEDISGIIAKAKSVSYDRTKKVCRIVCEAKLFSLDAKNIEEKISQISAQINEKTSVLDSKKQEANKIKEEIESLESELQKQQISLADKEAILKNAQSNFERISEELSVLEFEHSDVEENIAKLNQKEIETKGELEEINKESDTLESVINDSQNLISTNSKLRESLLLEITQSKSELNSIKTKVNDLSTTASMLERSLSAEKEALNTQELEKEDCKKKIVELTQESAVLKTEIENLKIKFEQFQTDHSNRSEVLVQKDSILKNLRSEHEVKISEIDESKEFLHKQQLNLQENAFKLNQIKERMTQVYQYDIDQEGQIIDLTGFNPSSSKEEIDVLRKKADGFGTVNLVAIEELNELKERYNFLEQQQKDLNSAKESLSEAIRKINRTTKKMFLDTFHTVAKEFKNYFRLLFGGGDAELFLLDEENVLESGIEIICRPPGKKLQNILLLSGGEKSLSAIALIFAIFKTKPAPFCVLDEIDAALDESNVDRYSRMLKDFAQLSQFIVITHNKKTIVHADVMYGITMEQSGISKIVSVKLSESKKEASAKERKKTLSAAENK